MPTAISPDDANLQLAVSRLRRLLRIWSALYAAMGIITFAVLGPEHLYTAVVWLLGAALLFFVHQPLLFALVAVQIALSLILILPGLSGAFGPDPISLSIGSGAIEILGLALVRIILAISAWNQFLFYRMLYGTERASGLDPDTPPIPEIVENWTDQFAYAAAGVGLLSLLAASASTTLIRGPLTSQGLDVALGLATYAIGLGLGSAFSPTNRRGYALLGIILGIAGFLSAIVGSQLV